MIPGELNTNSQTVLRNSAGFPIVLRDGVQFVRVTSSTNTFFLPVDHDIFDTDTTTTVSNTQDHITVIQQPYDEYVEVDNLGTNRYNHDIEICGLQNSTNGRSCSIHNVCGLSVQVGDILRLRQSVADINGEPELAIKLVKIVDGMEACTVAFIPRMQTRLPYVREQIGRFCMVTELYRYSANTMKIAKENTLLGGGIAVLLDYIPEEE